jgi:hypothetical protein
MSLKWLDYGMRLLVLVLLIPLLMHLVEIAVEALQGAW